MKTAIIFLAVVGIVTWGTRVVIQLEKDRKNKKRSRNQEDLLKDKLYVPKKLYV